MKIGIIGAGHAGISAAQAIAKGKNEVTLFSNENTLPYFRPKIPSLAFGQSTEEDAVMHPLDWYKNQNINLKLNEPIIKITPNGELINKKEQKFSFDKILLAYGAKPIIPAFAKNCKKDSVIPLWNMNHAQTISKKINSLKNIVIIGGGVIGIETALRATDAGLNVSIIERNNYLMERNLTVKASKLLEQILKIKGIKLFTGHTVENINDSSKIINISTDKGNMINADLVVLSLGNTFDLNLTENAELSSNRAILTDNYMQTSNKNYYAAGDIAQIPNIINVCSAIKAIKQGKIAGANAIITSNSELIPFEPGPVSVLLKYKEFQLYAVGETLSEDSLTEVILEEKPGETYRAVIKKDKKIVGIQMIGSLADYKKLEKELSTNQAN
jgi:NAD(P)H-nitrite reductase large subunit